jgi:hypothetical protein
MNRTGPATPTAAAASPQADSSHHPPALPAEDPEPAAAGLRPAPGMHDRAASRAGAALPRTALVCRHCLQPAAVLGDDCWGKAVHALTGEETGRDGHVAAPLETTLFRAALETGAAP